MARLWDAGFSILAVRLVLLGFRWTGYWGNKVFVPKGGFGASFGYKVHQNT
jgi:hypothetical protein